MAGSIKQAQFNRVAKGIMGATGNFSLICSVEQPSPKYLNSIFVSAQTGTSPYSIVEYQIRIIVCSQQGKLADLPTVNDFAPFNVNGIDNIGEVGTVYYDHVITIPYNTPIPFDESIYFSNGEKIFVACSIPYANGESIVAPPNKFVKMSINGHIIDAPTRKYNER